jgi:hypothetical protein
LAALGGMTAEQEEIIPEEKGRHVPKGARQRKYTSLRSMA